MPLRPPEPVAASAVVVLWSMTQISLKFGAAADLIDHGGLGLGCQSAAAARTVLDSQFTVQQSQVMVNFGEGSHGGSAAGIAGSLFNGHRRGQAGYQIDIRSFQDFHVLTDIGCQAFEIATLAFGKKDIKGQGRFSRTGDTGQHHHFVVGQGQIDVL